MIPSIMNGGPPTSVRSTILGVLVAWETPGALRIFERSVVTRALKYKDMLGDGDSSTYSCIVESKPYAPTSWSVWDMSRRESVADYEN